MEKKIKNWRNRTSEVIDIIECEDASNKHWEWDWTGYADTVYSIRFIPRIHSSFPAVPGTVSGSNPEYIYPFQQSKVQYPVHILNTVSPRYSIRFISRMHSSFPKVPDIISGSYSGYTHPFQQSQVQYPVHIPDTFILYYSPRYNILFISQIHSSFSAVQDTVSGSYSG